MPGLQRNHRFKQEVISKCVCWLSKELSTTQPGCIEDGIHVSRVVVASDKIPPHSYFELRAICACLKSIHWLMLPAKHRYETWETPEIC